MELIIGSHVSFKKDEQLLGSTKEAISYGSNTFMFYTGAPQNTLRQVINDDLTKQAYKLMKENDIDVNNIIVHAPYIINLANNNSFAIDFLKQEIKRVEQLGISKLVLHPGSSVSLEKEEGLQNIIDGLNKVDNKSKVLICLETMAGKGSELGTTFEEINAIITQVKYPLGVCLDTCHISDAGYNVSAIDEVLDLFDHIIGLDKLKCIHINDSKNVINSHKDRHENFGFGNIGFDNLIKIIYNEKLKDVPKILETPYVSLNEETKDRLYPPYKFEIEMIKNKQFNSNLKEEIRAYYK
ncbi:MAG: deoxyribonuclease IV [Bacilli bacterium]